MHVFLLCILIFLNAYFISSYQVKGIGLDAFRCIQFAYTSTKNSESSVFSEYNLLSPCFPGNTSMSLVTTGLLEERP